MTGYRNRKLSNREMQILECHADGRTNDWIAEELSLSVETIKHHNKNIREKMRVRSVKHAVATALRQGVIQ